MASRLGFDESDSGKVALVATEAATNLVKHAAGGELLLSPLECGDVIGMEILALDKGPGMADPDRCFRDGFSTAGSPGSGLGAMVRLSDLFEIHTVPGVGTGLLARMWSQPVPAPTAGLLQTGVVHLPKPGEDVSGDGWAIEWQGRRCTILLTDGLGHGPIAAEAARESIRIFRENTQVEPVEVINRIHGALRSTRGAAIAIAQINPDDCDLRFVGVGNISGTICSDGTSRSMVSHNGIVGHQIRKVQEFSYPFPQGAIFVMHSDGLATQWRMDQFTGLAIRQPILIAGVLYREFKRIRDDVTVLVVREAP